MKNKIKYNDMEVLIEHDGEDVVDISGDDILINFITPYFSEPVEIVEGTSKKVKNTLIFSDEYIVLKKGDKGYINAVLLNKLQNQMGMEIE